MSDPNEDETLSFFQLISSYLTKVLCHQTPRKCFFFFSSLPPPSVSSSPPMALKIIPLLLSFYRNCACALFSFFLNVDTVLIEFLKRIHLILFFLNELMHCECTYSPGPVGRQCQGQLIEGELIMPQLSVCCSLIAGLLCTSLISNSSVWPGSTALLLSCHSLCMCVCVHACAYVKPWMLSPRGYVSVVMVSRGWNLCCVCASTPGLGGITVLHLFSPKLPYNWIYSPPPKKNRCKSAATFPNLHKNFIFRKQSRSDDSWCDSGR